MRLRGHVPAVTAQADGPEASTLAMVAVYPRLEEAEALAVEGGLEVDDLHCTLVFLGEVEDVDQEAVSEAVAQVALELAALEGAVGGMGEFGETPDGVPVLALPDVQGLTLLRERIVDELGHRGVRSPSEHGFLPHMTLISKDPAEDWNAIGELSEEVLGRELHFDAVSAVFGDSRTDYELAGARVAAATVDDLTAATERARERLEENVPALAGSYESVLLSAGRRIARSFRAQAVPLVSSEDVLVSDAGFTPPDEDEVVDSDRLSDEMRESSSEAQRQASRDVAAALEAEGISFDVDAVFTDELLEAIGARATFAADQELRQVYRDVIANAAEEGWSVSRAADEIVQRVEGLAAFRAQALARTDLNGLANGGSVHVAQQTVAREETVYKTWLATDDEVTRDSHVDADGQSVPVNEPFHVGGVALRYPGDPFGPAEEVMNCRCTIIYGSTPGGAVVSAAGTRRQRGLGFATVPYHKETGNSECEDGQVAVVKDDDDQVMGCHDTEEEADDQIAAIEANEEDSMSTRTRSRLGAGRLSLKQRREIAAAEDYDQRIAAMRANGNGEVVLRDPINWDATLCVEGEPTEDGRLLVRGGITWRDLPLTLMGLIETSEWGHEGAQVAGRIDEILRVADDITATGDLTTDFGIDTLAPMIADRTVRGVSIDLAVLDYEYRDRETGETLDEDDLFVYWLEGKESQILFAVLDGVIVGATVCPMPAIANAEIALAACAGLDLPARQILAAALEGSKVSPGDVPIIRVFTPFERARREGLFAAAAVDLGAPPRSAFELTEFPGKTPLTVADPDEAGWRRVFGHIATWDTCHVGIPGVCTTAPRSSTDPPYAYFHTSRVVVAEGETLDVGNLMLGTGHASLGASRMEATRHYDKPDMVGARVRATDGEHGIWVSGVVRGELTETGVRELRENPPSGDWRSVNGRLELIAVCAVAVPGFPVVADAQANITAAGGEIGISALIASPGLIVPTSEVKEALLAAGCGCEDLATNDEGVDELADLAVSD